MKLENAKIITRIVASQTNAQDLATPTADLLKTYEQDYDDGAAIDQAQVIFSDTRTVAAGATDSLDLAGGLPHSLGGSITFTAIKEIFIYAHEANTGNLLAGEGVANAFQGPFGAAAVGNLVGPHGIYHQREPSAAGWPVVGGTGDVLAIENLGGAAADYDIVIIGEGAAA